MRTAIAARLAMARKAVAEPPLCLHHRHCILCAVRSTGGRYAEREPTIWALQAAIPGSLGSIIAFNKDASLDEIYALFDRALAREVA